jgi:hypothetical protein
METEGMTKNNLASNLEGALILAKTNKKRRIVNVAIGGVKISFIER